MIPVQAGPSVSALGQQALSFEPINQSGEGQLLVRSPREGVWISWGLATLGLLCFCPSTLNCACYSLDVGPPSGRRTRGSI